MDEETTESPVTVHKRMQENKTKRHRTGSNERTDAPRRSISHTEKPRHHVIQPFRCGRHVSYPPNTDRPGIRQPVLFRTPAHRLYIVGRNNEILNMAQRIFIKKRKFLDIFQKRHKSCGFTAGWGLSLNLKRTLSLTEVGPLHRPLQQYGRHRRQLPL